MSNDFFVSADEFQNESDGSGSFVKKVILGIGILLVIGIFSGLSYYLGSKSKSEQAEIEIATTQVANELLKNIENIPSPTTFVLNTSTSSAETIPSTLTKEIVLKASPDLDGYRVSTGTGKDRSEIRVGFTPGQVSRGFFGFSIDEIPSNSQIISATLRLYQAQFEGNPYDVGNFLKIDHLTFGEDLDSKDYATAAVLYNFDTLSKNIKKEYKEVDVKNRLQEDLFNARSVSQYRIHFEEEKSVGSFNFVNFESSENYLNTNNTPELVVEYIPNSEKSQ